MTGFELVVVTMFADVIAAASCTVAGAVQGFDKGGDS
jgi:hypothetical protein